MYNPILVNELEFAIKRASLVYSYILCNFLASNESPFHNIYFLITVGVKCVSGSPESLPVLHQSTKYIDV